VADVLEADGVPDAAHDPLAPRDVRMPAWKLGLITVRRGLGRRERGAPPYALRDRRRAHERLARDDGVALDEPVPHADLDGIEAARLRKLVHLRLVGKTGLHGAEPAHRTRGRIVRSRTDAVDDRVGDAVGAGRERARVRDDSRARRTRRARQRGRCAPSTPAARGMARAGRGPREATAWRRGA